MPYHIYDGSFKPDVWGYGDLITRQLPSVFDVYINGSTWCQLLWSTAGYIDLENFTSLNS